MQACASLALALLTFIVKAKSWNETLPAPPPVPYANVPLFVSPQEKLATSIAPGCLLSLDSPGTPSITRRTSFGMAFLRSPQPGRTSRAEYLKVPASASSILVRRRDALGAARNRERLFRRSANDQVQYAALLRPTPAAAQRPSGIRHQSVNPISRTDPDEDVNRPVLPIRPSFEIPACNETASNTCKHKGLQDDILLKQKLL